MIESASFQKVKDCINRGQRFVLTTHVNPDGDGLGSEAALAAFLQSRGKDVFIFNCNPVPDNYHFLDPENQMVAYKSSLNKEILLTADYVFILDISDWARLRSLGKDVKDTSIPKICIDHHPRDGKFGDVSLVDVAACSTGEIIYDLIKFCNGEFNPEMAKALYTSILTDTGSFKFSNTSARSFTIVSDLVDMGANPNQVFQQVYENQTLNKVKLFGYVINNLKFEEDGRVVWFTIPKEIMEALGTRSHETEGFADYPRVIKGVEVSLMFIEHEKGTTKVSIRSKGKYVINTVAQKFGGGGHPFAAGILLNGEMTEHIPKLLTEVSKLISG